MTRSLELSTDEVPIERGQAARSRYQDEVGHLAPFSTGPANAVATPGAEPALSLTSPRTTGIFTHGANASLQGSRSISLASFGDSLDRVACPEE
jgi:hypothetical protein